ncbi:hypothetical protein LCGC14_2739320 [marine sediment metagenome]|uniref:Uncharacterized protein n=1 Tax=marine sediment metagenome TaxID=412755 RepID=A0A0F8ZS94_9ZZZZ
MMEKQVETLGDTMKVIDVIWFNSRFGACGLVVAENEGGERKIYGGVVLGLDPRADKHELRSWGNKVDIEKLEGFIAKAKVNEPEPKPVKEELPEMISILELSTGKALYLTGGELTRDDAHEAIVRLTEIWGTDFEKQGIKDKALGLK